jgi:hypothetical protein
VAGLIALAAVALLGLLLIADVAVMAGDMPEVRTSGDDYLSILASEGRNQVVNFVIGAALHDDAGVVTELVVPVDPVRLSARPGDAMIAGEQPAFQVRRLTRIAGGRIVKRDYEPRVATTTIDAWQASGRLAAYPRDVFLLRSARADGRWVLLTDAARMRILIVSVADLPPGVVLP